MKRIGTYRRKTRSKLKKGIATKGKVSISRYFAKYEIGDRVCLKAEPAVHKGIYFPRFHGKIGEVVAKTGNCYKVLIKDFKKQKILIVHPVHLKKIAANNQDKKEEQGRSK